MYRLKTCNVVLIVSLTISMDLLHKPNGRPLYKCYYKMEDYNIIQILHEIQSIQYDVRVSIVCTYVCLERATL